MVVYVAGEAVTPAERTELGDRSVLPDDCVATAVGGVHAVAHDLAFVVNRIRVGTTRFDAARRRGLTRLVERHRELEIIERTSEESRSGGIRFLSG